MKRFYLATLIIPIVLLLGWNSGYAQTLTATPSTLNFGNVLAGAPSTPALFFTISGTGMTGSVTVSVTGSGANSFEIATNGTSWPTTFAGGNTIPGVGGPVAFTQNIYVKFDNPATGTYSATITISGGGLSSPVSVPVTGTSVSQCTGVVGGGITPVATTVTGGSSVTLSLSGLPAFGGYTYQWLSSATGVSTSYSPIAGAILPTYTETGETATTYYECSVSCASAGASAVFGTGTVNYNAYASSSCTPSCVGNAAVGTMCSSFGAAVGNGAANPFQIRSGATVLLTDPKACPLSSPYTDQSSSITGSLAPGQTYTVAVGSGNADPVSTQLWIDFNNDGIFQSTESLGGITNFSGASTFTITIPANETPGIYRLRVAVAYDNGFTSGHSLYPNYPNIEPCPGTNPSVDPEYQETRESLSLTRPVPVHPHPVLLIYRLRRVVPASLLIYIV
jgi:hypothetical protein